MFSIRISIRFHGPINTGGGTLVAASPLNVIVNGDIAVRYFFVLSGFLSTAGIIRKRKLDLAQSAINRYLRLFPVVFAATLFAAILMGSQLLFHIPVSDLANNSDYMSDYFTFELNIQNILYNLFLKPFVGGSDFVGPFWTIRYEFWGTLMTLAISYLFLDKKWRRIGYILFGLRTCSILDGNYLGFFVGMFIADLFYNTDEQTTYFSRYYQSTINKKCFLSLCAVAGVYLACVPIEFGSIYSFLRNLPISSEVYRTIGVGLIMYLVLNVSRVQKLLENKVLTSLGKMSFSIYAFHWPLQCSLQFALFVWLIGPLGYDYAALLSFAIEVIAVIFVAFVSSRFIDVSRRRIELKN